MKRGYLIDMDGVLYRGATAIPGAAAFIAHLHEEKIPYLFLTNNSTYTPLDVVFKLQKMGIETTQDHVYTSGMATAAFLHQQKPNGTAFVIGEGGLLLALNDVQYAITRSQPDFVVVGEGRTLTYEMCEVAHRCIASGAGLISTNADTWCPTDEGPRPGCGAIVALLEAASGKKAYHVGKPNPFMMRAARKRMGLATDEITMIGYSRGNRPRFPLGPRAHRVDRKGASGRLPLSPHHHRRVDCGITPRARPRRLKNDQTDPRPPPSGCRGLGSESTPRQRADGPGWSLVAVSCAG